MPTSNAHLLEAYATYQQRVETLLHLMASYGSEQLNRSPGPGQWSAIQVAHHLLLVEQLALRYVKKKLSFRPVLRKAGLREAANRWFLQLYLRTPLRFRAPDAVGEQHLPAFATLADTRQQWEEVREAWRNFLEEMPEELSDKAIFRHPRVGRLSWLGTFAFLKAHLERHRRQVFKALQRQR